MSDTTESGTTNSRMTDGEIAVINLESARRRSWSRFSHDPTRAGVAETVVEHERLAAQFLGEVFALDRLEALVKQLAEVDPESARSAVIQAQVASMAHRFAEARRHLVQAKLAGAPADDVRRLEMSIDQACGVDLDGLLRERRQIAEKSGGLEDLVALGALLADLRDFIGADGAYARALRVYRDVSPFPVAWVCFQRGLLWGELAAELDAAQAAHWYRKAVDCLPRYTRARVHLAENYASSGRASDAEALLAPVVASGDPEVSWRLADVLASQGKLADAEARLQAAHSGFEFLLDRHPLAFADHGAEFYAGSGNNLLRALELARINVANRPTLRAFEQAYAIAVSAGERAAASEMLGGAMERWGAVRPFSCHSLGKAASRWDKEQPHDD